MTPKQTKEIKKLIKWAIKQGINITVAPDGTITTLGPMGYATPPPRKQLKPKIETDPELLKNDVDAMMPSDGDLLFWSSSTYEELVEGRKGPAVNEEK